MRRPSPYQTNTGVHIEWFTVRRSTVVTLAIAVAALFAAGGWAVYRITNPAPPEVVTADTFPDNSASFVELSGSVEVRKAGTYEWVAAHMRFRLNKEDTIKTTGNSTARLRLFDGTEYLLKADSILVIEESFEDPTTKATRVSVKLQTGQVNLRTPRREVFGSRSDLETPTVQASFEENTSADVSFDTNRRTAGVTVFTGGSALTSSGGETLTLVSSQMVEVNANARFSKVYELPGVPALVQPTNHSRTPVAGTTKFQWKPVQGARRYHVRLDRTPTFPDPILDSYVKGLSMVYENLPPGTYYWEVSAIDADDRAGAPSDFAKFSLFSGTMRPTAEAPRLSVLRPEVFVGGLVEVRGKTDSGAFVTVDTGAGPERVTVKPDGTFTHRFIVTEAGRHRVNVKARRREGGGTAEETVYAEVGTGR